MPADEFTTRRLLMVIGQGRSGTSVLATILKEFGCVVPQPEVQANASNPAGFGEPRWLVDFHKSALKKSKVSHADARPEAWALTVGESVNPATIAKATKWLEPHFDDAPVVLLKDPRLLWFTQIWEQVAVATAAQPLFISMLRKPSDIVASKINWYGAKQSTTSRAATYVNTMLLTERATRNYDRLWINYDDLMADWIAVMTSVAGQFNIPMLTSVTAGQEARARGVIDPARRSSSSTWDELNVPTPLACLADRVFDVLQSLDGRPAQETRDELERIRDEYCAMYEAAASMAESSAAAAYRRGVARGRKVERQASKQKRAAPAETPHSSGGAPGHDTEASRAVASGRPRPGATLRRATRRLSQVFKADQPAT